jgi:TolB-like protein
MRRPRELPMRGNAPLLLLCALGCTTHQPPEKRPVNAYLADPRDLASVRRVMVLPFAEESGVTAETDRLRDAYLAELQKLRRFEIVPLPASAQECALLNHSARVGELSTEAVVHLCDRYYLDGVLIGSVTAWRAYMPQQLGMRTELVSVHSGAIVWAVDALYDAADRSTISDLRHYYEHMEADDNSLHGWEINLIAPSWFARYVAHRFVGTWTDG